jgi:hypothetical protein
MKATIRKVTLALNKLIPIRRYLLGISGCDLVKIRSFPGLTYKLGNTFCGSDRYAR